LRCELDGLLKPYMKKFLLLVAAGTVSLLSSCNTTIGVGRDMRILGENMENAANKKLQGGGETQDTSGAPVY
jgi:predicted small secreted protein